MKTVRLSSAYFWIRWPAVAFVASLPISAYSDTSVSKVSLTVAMGAVKVPSAGTLYKVSAEQRSHVADVASDGKISRAVSCSEGEQFEAEAESSLARPVAPVRRSCGETMAFAFKRAVLVSWDVNGSNPFSEPSTGSAVYSKYATIFADKGQSTAANAWSDAAVASTAVEALGDKKLDMFVMRDPKRSYRLVLNAKGTEALKEKQKGWGIEPTGRIDLATQFAIAKPPTSDTAALRPVSALKCVLRDETVICVSPKKSTPLTPEFENWDAYPFIANLPSVPLNPSKE